MSAEGNHADIRQLYDTDRSSVMEYKIHRNLHTDFRVFEENKLTERSYFIPFSSVAALADRKSVV